MGTSGGAGGWGQVEMQGGGDKWEVWRSRGMEKGQQGGGVGEGNIKLEGLVPSPGH